MIPSGLVRAKVQGRTITPSLVDPDKPAIAAAAEAVQGMFRDAAADARRLGEVLADLDELCAERRDHRMVRGLAHLARQRCELQEPSHPDPAALRWAVFRAAAKSGPLSLQSGPLELPTADDVLAEVADAQGLTAQGVREALYADHDPERRLGAFDVASPRWLVDRYNVALVQSLLLKATDVRVELHDPTAPRVQQLFRWVKFHQLLHRAERAGPTLRIQLDGPMSLFRSSTRYGQRLARFFATLPLQDRPWSLQATVLWTRAKHRKDLAVDQDTGLVSHIRDTGAWRTKAQQHLIQAFAAADTPWRLLEGQRPLRVGGSVVYPDFTVTDGTRIAHLEVWGHWREERLAQRVTSLDATEGVRHLVVAVPAKLASGKGNAVPEHPQLIRFSELLSVRKVIGAVDRVAVPIDADVTTP